jgi:hypothetical protein
VSVRTVGSRGVLTNARDPVVLEGRAEVVTDAARIGAFVDAVNAKDGAGLTPDFQAPAVNGTFAVSPVRVFALSGADVAGSPTRWTFA